MPRTARTAPTPGPRHPVDRKQALAESHTPAQCERVPRSEQFHTKSRSYRFACPVCGAERRQNTNYLGRKELVCDGRTMKAIKRREEAAFADADQRATQ